MAPHDVGTGYLGRAGGWGPAVVPGVCTVHRLVLTPTVTALEPHAAFCHTIKYVPLPTTCTSPCWNYSEKKHLILVNIGNHDEARNRNFGWLVKALGGFTLSHLRRLLGIRIIMVHQDSGDYQDVSQCECSGDHPAL